MIIPYIFRIVNYCTKQSDYSCCAERYSFMMIKGNLSESITKYGSDYFQSV